MTGRRSPAPWLPVAVALVLVLFAGCATGAGSTPRITPLPPQARVLIFGDSYTQGVGAEPQNRGYAYLMGAALGWSVTVDGVGGTGYLAPAPTNRGPYLKRLPGAPGGPFDLIVLQGSTNDERQPLAALRPAVEQTVAAFRDRYPGTRIIMLGPIAVKGVVSEPKAAVNETLKAYAKAHEVAYIDAIAESWFATSETATMANPTNGHPSNAGYQRIQDRLAIDLVRLTVGPGSP